MADLDNLGFETGSLTPGKPAFWLVTSTPRGLLFAEYGTGSPQLDSETFEEEWSSNESYDFAIDTGTIVAAAYDASVGEPETREDFEEGWSSNQGYLFANPILEAADYAGDEFEAFESGWDTNESYDFTLPSVTAASYDSAGTPENVEDFEELWRSNQSYLTSLPASTAAIYDTAEAYEDFEESAVDMAISSIDVSTNVFTIASHGLSNGNRIAFRNEDGQLPGNVQDDVLYYVISAATNTFKISATSGGSEVDVTSTGFGTQYVQRDPALYWRYAP